MRGSWRSGVRATMTTACAVALAGAMARGQVQTSAPPQTPASAAATAAQNAAAGTAELLFDQGKQLFDAFQYDQAVPLFDRVVSVLTAGGQIQRPDLLVQAYELRARARFAQGDSLGTEQDFSALLAINPGFKLSPGISPRVVAVFDAVRKVTVGQIALSLTPPGPLQIDGRPYTAQADAQPVDLTAGDHQVSATRPGYRPIAQPFTVTAGAATPLALVLERVSSTLTVVSVPDDVDVLVDGTSRGHTTHGPGPGPESAPLIVTDLQAGAHRLQLHRDCYTSVERTITIQQPGDLQSGTLTLTPTVASVKIDNGAPGASIFIDGVARGTAPASFANVCAGPHTIEVRGSGGRFIDHRDWNAGDSVTLTPALRSAFPIVVANAGSGLTADQVRDNLEHALAPAQRILVYAPVAADLERALSGETVPQGWLVSDPNAAETAGPRVPAEVTRDLGQQLAQKLGTQGIAVATAGADPYTVTLSLLAAGSSEPDVLTVGTADAASRGRALAALDAPLPPLLRPSIETSTIDVQGVKGAVVIRSGAKSGLALGDVIVGAGGSPVSSVADLQARIAAVHAPAADLALDVKNAAGATRKASVPVVMTPDTLPMRDPSLMYNRLLIDLQNALKTATGPLEAAIHVNLGIVQMRLGNWDEAQKQLHDAALPDGAGVSSGTAAYLTGLCLEAVGRAAEAQAAFTKAAASTQARLWYEGPLVAPLAQQKLRAGR